MRARASRRGRAGSAFVAGVAERLLFYNTLFDENPGSHLALGQTFSSCIESGERMAVDDLSLFAKRALCAIHGTPRRSTAGAVTLFNPLDEVKVVRV